MDVALIVAMAADRVIGRDNALPWRLPSDLKRFKALTMGCPIVMGRKTYESIGRPLPGRRNIVLSRQDGFAPAGVDVMDSLDAALAVDAERVFVIGGAQIYAQALPRATHVFLTQVHKPVVGDARFPEVDWAQWALTAYEECEPAEGDECGFSLFDFKRDPHVIAESPALQK